MKPKTAKVQWMFETPYDYFQAWYGQARDAGVPQYDAMALVTASSAAKPAARMVLLRGVVDGKFRFFTNYDSRKSKELLENPLAQLLFYWPQLGHQIRIEGEVTKLSEKESDEYWESRPRESRIGGIASHQSRTLSSMDELRTRVKEVEELYQGKDVPRPPHWGGFGLEPQRFEFWRDGEFRLHERIVYERLGGEWIHSRLWP